MQLVNKWARGMIVGLTAVSFLGACTSTTAIRTTDPMARIYVDGEYKGMGAVNQSDSKIVGSSTQVRIEKDGCAPIYTQYSRGEELDVGALIGGLFFLVPFLWIMKYKPDHVFEYSCHPKR